MKFFLKFSSFLLVYKLSKGLSRLFRDFFEALQLISFTEIKSNILWVQFYDLVGLGNYDFLVLDLSRNRSFAVFVASTTQKLHDVALEIGIRRQKLGFQNTR